MAGTMVLCPVGNSVGALTWSAGSKSNRDNALPRLWQGHVEDEGDGGTREKGPTRGVLKETMTGRGIAMKRKTFEAMLATSLAAGLAVAPGFVAGQGGCAMAAGLAVRSSQGYLGVNIRDVSDDQVAALKLKESRGAEIVRVDHDGPAGMAGLREHDVVLQMNGQVMEGQEQLRRMLHEIPAGRTVSLVISRDGQQQTVTVTMANREELERKAWEQHLTVPEPDGVGAPAVAAGNIGGGGSGAPRGGMGFFHGGGPGSRGDHNFLATMMGQPYTGAMLEPVGPQLAEFFGVQGGLGLLVRSVEANSPAATAGMKAGDVVVKVNQVTVAGMGDWAKTVHESKGKPMPVTVLREKREQTLMLTPDPKRRSAVEWPESGPGFVGGELAGPELLMASMR